MKSLGQSTGSITALSVERSTSHHGDEHYSSFCFHFRNGCGIWSILVFSDGRSMNEGFVVWLVINVCLVGLMGIVFYLINSDVGK